MKRGSTDAETCRLNGWGPGTRLTGEENGRSATITITAIGRASVLAIRDGLSIESVWSLSHREWRLAPASDPVGGASEGDPAQYRAAELRLHEAAVECANAVYDKMGLRAIDLLDAAVDYAKVVNRLSPIGGAS